MWTIVATWRMALEGVQEASKILAEQGDACDAVETAGKMVEDNQWYKSVGFGGLPNEEMDVELDAGFMNGNTMGVGAVAGIHDFANPISIARRLSREETNCMLAGLGAERFASHEGFERKNMLTDRAKRLYREKIQETKQTQNPYKGHDTVGIAAVDQNGKIAAGTSTSGLFLKKPGRIGDSPVVGSGFYADSETGAACATGLGEDLMKGCISYEIVRRMKDGEGVQDACDHAVSALEQKLRRSRGKAGDLSVVAIDKNGNYGAATNIDGFSFVVMKENEELKVFVTKANNGHTTYSEASEEWLAEYMSTHSALVEKK
ncbi:MAG: N(4)-(beta-N-acetylglucosaminyl)-L-asparaginase [Solobacterium sp.]|jgi:N4-(beta-N-acetylglucosaminyl)-L-asparaginase|nr:N(4)-(beta-N-acetylglucosaminyl)-L-asparaginase [Solobacterium sp.]MCH4205981.1 N(4)-(beta-N-acetylglucosaminyl)-L-asparaginase [Solobacterium sp.]MCH4227411.1 N(4)-(beta-N-acetylglucosaminyl)-L-asparaginase [Solobacterium sp.]MCH4282780.1 N(4)-(beta-N-acetylglucosaminyl)-L-asparaginase [Solobacterium sp.]